MDQPAPTADELASLIATVAPVCHKHGVSGITVGGVSMTFWAHASMGAAGAPPAPGDVVPQSAAPTAEDDVGFGIKVVKR